MDNRREYYRHYRLRQRSNVATQPANLLRQRQYYQTNRDQINARRREARDRAANRLRELNETEYLGESHSDQVLPLTIGTLSVECNHCGALSFPKEHGRINASKS